MIDWFFFFNLSPCVPRGGAIFEGPGRVVPEGCPSGGYYFAMSVQYRSTVTTVVLYTLPWPRLFLLVGGFVRRFTFQQGQTQSNIPTHTSIHCK